MNTLRIQGIVFIIIANIAILASLFFIPLNSDNLLIILAVFILVLGVPHGALDTVFAVKLYNIKTLWSWLVFTIIYLLLVIFVIMIWRYLPLIFLSGFLIISIVHFSGDPKEGTHWMARILYGGAPIVLPVILYATEMERLFAFLIDAKAANDLVSIIGFLGIPWGLSLLFFSIRTFFTDALTGIEIAVTGLLAVLVTPLTAFTLFFCCMHSPRHILRTIEYAQPSSWKNLAAIAVAPLFGVVVLLFASAYFFDGASLDAKIIQIIFVGLAALTLPHMILVEQVRFFGKGNGQPPI
jgi:Brp/Blh family beta-carotene 15,15'-monooxygenase